MLLLLAEHRTQLIKSILDSNSLEDVKRICNASMKLLEENKVISGSAAQFADEVIRDLESLRLITKDVRQWVNIHMARIHLDLIKQKLPK
jgi:hypothetical protein